MMTIIRKVIKKKWFIELKDYKELNHPILFDQQFKEAIKEIVSKEKNSPFDKEGNLNQIYCAELSDDLRKILDEMSNNRNEDMTIAKAAKKALSEIGKRSNLETIYNKIIEGKLYSFGAQNPKDVLRVQIERFSDNVPREYTSKIKFFRRYENQHYGLIEWTLTNVKVLCKNTILYGPPGTGKTFKTKEKAVEILEDKSQK